MVKISKQQQMYFDIERHGKQLLAIFPAATEQDPLKLCKKLRRLELAANAIALRECNGEARSDDDRQWEKMLTSVDILLNFKAAGVPVFLNGDPRGYTLKIEDEYVRANNLDIYRDWGGYGIVAPDFSQR